MDLDHELIATIYHPLCLGKAEVHIENEAVGMVYESCRFKAPSSNYPMRELERSSLYLPT